MTNEMTLKMINRHKAFAENYAKEYNEAIVERDHEDAAYLIKQFYTHMDAIRKLQAAIGH